jgi:hypothetical protein
LANSDDRPVTGFVTSKTSPKITATLDRAHAELRQAGRCPNELVSAYFGCCADLRCALDKVERVRHAGRQQLAKVTAAVEEKVRAAEADCQPVRASVAQALVAADSVGDPTDWGTMWGTCLPNATPMTIRQRTSFGAPASTGDFEEPGAASIDIPTELADVRPEHAQRPVQVVAALRQAPSTRDTAATNASSLEPRSHVGRRLW